MQDILVNEFEDLAVAIMDNSKKDKYVSVIGYCEDIQQLIKTLCRYRDINIYNIEIYSYDYNGYDKEFVLTLDIFGDIWCEPFYKNERYLSIDSGVVYVFSDINSKCLKGITSEEIIEVIFDDDEESDVELCNCPLCKIERDDMSFIKELRDGYYEFYYDYLDNKSSYSVSYSSVNLDDVKEVRNKFFEI